MVSSFYSLLLDLIKIIEHIYLLKIICYGLMYMWRELDRYYAGKDISLYIVR